MRALIIEDQPLLVSGLRAVLGNLASPIAVSCAESADAARHELASDPRFDLVLLDLELNGSAGLDLLGELRSTHPALSIVVLSASDDDELVGRAIFMGAMGFVLKRASTTLLVEALHLVLSGGVYMPPLQLPSSPAPGPRATARDDGWGLRLGQVPAGEPRATHGPASSLGLTSRQAEVLEHLLLGQSNKLIARALNLSDSTVKDHVGSLLRKLKVTTRTQAVLAMGRLSHNGRPANAVPSGRVSSA